MVCGFLCFQEIYLLLLRAIFLRKVVDLQLLTRFSASRGRLAASEINFPALQSTLGAVFINEVVSLTNEKIWPWGHHNSPWGHLTSKTILVKTYKSSKNNPCSWGVRDVWSK